MLLEGTCCVSGRWGLGRQSWPEGCANERVRYAQVRSTPRTWRWIYWIHPHLPSVLVMLLHSSQLPSNSLRGPAADAAFVFSPIHIQVIAFERILWACKLAAFVQIALIADLRRSKSQSLQVHAVLLTAAEWRWPPATSDLARCLRSYLSCWLLLMQQKAFPSSRYPSNRREQIRVVMRQNKNTRHKTEAQMLSFMTSLFPFVAKGYMVL